MKLSVLIVARNTAWNINKCIQSILNQKWKDEIEIIICDDASEDGLYDIIPSYIKKVRNEEHLGISKSFNKISPMATGDYIFFMGSDDYLTGNFFSYAYDMLKSGSEAVTTQMLIEDVSGKKYGVGKLYMPIFHRKYLIKWPEYNKMEHGADKRQVTYMRELGVKFITNPSPDYHYVRWDKNITMNRKKSLNTN
jgi:glycosyltransferase involved in cell wall biosynthesis